MNTIEEWKEKVLNKYFIKNGPESLSPDEVDHILDWFKSDEGSQYHSSILRISVPSALAHAKNWIKTLSNKHAREEKGDTSLVLTLPGGFSWVKLLTANALTREGTLMKHCVASYNKKIKDKDSEIFSLRDSLNHPHCTIEIAINREFKDGFILGQKFQKSVTRKIKQIKGKANGLLAEKYLPFLKEFLTHAENILKLEIKKNTFVYDNLFYYQEKIVHFDTLSLIEGNLTLAGTSKKFNENLIVKGNVNISNYKGDLPKNFTVEGSLIYDPKILTIPENWKISDLVEKDSTARAWKPLNLVIEWEAMAGGAIITQGSFNFDFGRAFRQMREVQKEGQGRELTIEERMFFKNDPKSLDMKISEENYLRINVDSLLNYRIIPISKANKDTMGRIKFFNNLLKFIKPIEQEKTQEVAKPKRIKNILNLKPYEQRREQRRF